MGLNEKFFKSASGGGVPVGDENFDIVTYTGNNNTKNITSLNFAPDLVWIKSRSNGTSHELNDRVRGQVSRLFSDSNSGQGTVANGFVSLDSNGFSLNNAGDGGEVNGANRTYVAWCWKAGGAASNITSASSNVSAAARSANAEAGFSIATYTTNSNSPVVIPHGLDSTPKVALVKNVGGSSDWFWVNTVATNKGRGFLNNGNAWDNAGLPTLNSTNITFQAGDPFSSGASALVYFFADVTGYQKIDTFQGSGGAGKFVSTGFQPRFVMIRTTASDNWRMYDAVRGNAVLYPNLSNTEDAASHVTFNSTGFTLNSDNSNYNGYTMFYLAIA
tara:strand:- start:36 stop:1028 length:993 start_codon:yes stop_codon:yes gene_type:complete